MACHAANKPVDITTVCDRLGETEELDTVGGRLGIVAFVEEIGATLRVLDYAKELIEKYILRRVREVSGAISERASNPGVTASEVLAEAEAAISGIRMGRISDGYVAPEQYSEEALLTIDQTEPPKSFVRSGLDLLDYYLTGYEPGRMYVVAGRPGMGKTALGVQLAASIGIEQKRCVGFLSLEMSRAMLVNRLLSVMTKVDSHRIRARLLQDDERHKLHSSLGVLAQSHLWIDDTPVSRVADIAARTRRLKREHGCSIVFIDFLQRITPSLPASMPHHERIGDISRKLKAMALDLDLPVVVLAQLNREIADGSSRGTGSNRRRNHRPELHHLAESGRIEQDADVVMFLHREDYYLDSGEPEDGKAELIIKKWRDGPTGTIQLNYDKATSRFWE